MTLSGWLRKIKTTMARRGNHSRLTTPAQRGAIARPRLELLEDRVVPAAIDTTTNIAISISPNLFARTATETVTATVTQAGTHTAITSGNVAFNLNGQTGTGTLNSSGQATFTATLPMYAVASNQTLLAIFNGATSGTDTFGLSEFLSPVYLNVMNAVLPSQITFGTPAAVTNGIPNFNSSGGETNTVSLFSIAIDFNYVDPGTIQTFTILGFKLPGSLSGTVFASFESLVASTSGQLL